jgi:Ca2+-binding RTX toxin-like protein
MNTHVDPKTLAMTQAAQSPQGKGPVLHLHAPQGGGHGGNVQVPSAALLTQGDYSRVGLDLMITGPDGQQVLVQDYFLTDNPPDLVSEDGAQIAGDLAERLAGSIAPGQFAQAGAGGVGKQSIGQVETVNGSVNVVHADGSKGVLHKGDAVFQGDVLQTAKGGAVGVVFLDKTSLSLGGDGRMVLDQMVYDPSSGSGKSAFSLVQGTFSFVSGQIAKSSPDAMVVRTPVATIGIRGTLGSAGYTTEKGLTAALFSEGNDGGSTVGELIISNQGGTQTINQPNLATQVLTFFTAPPPPVLVNSSQVQIYFGQSLQNLPPSPSNPDALRSVQQIQLEAQSKGIQAGLLASQTNGQATGDGKIEVRQLVSADQVAKDMVAQKGINALIDAKGVGGALESGKDIKAGIDKAISEGKSLQDVAKGIAGLLADALQKGDDTGHNKIDVVSRDLFNQEGHVKTDRIGDFMREVSERSGRDLHQNLIDQQLHKLTQLVVTTVLQDNSVTSGANDTTTFTDYKIGTSSSETLTGGTGNTEFIYYMGGGSSSAVIGGTTLDLSGSNLGGTDYLMDSGGSSDRVTFLNLDSILLRIRDVTTGDGYLEGDAMLTPTVTPTFGGDLIHISTNIEQIQAYDGDLSNLDNSVILKNAMTKIANSSNYGYIWAGTSGNDSISMSDTAYFSNVLGSIIFGKGGNDTITGTVDFLTNTSVLGNGGNDIIYGGIGNDTINGTSGSNTMDGGSGTDWLSYASADSVSIFIALGTSTHTDTTSTYSSTYGDSFSNFEHYKGSVGNDLFSFGGAFTTATSVLGDSGTDTMLLNGDYSSGVSLTNVDTVENLTLLGGNGYNITLGVSSSMVSVNAANAGDVTLDGSSNGSGFTYTGGSGTDSITGGSSNDTLIGAIGNDSLNGNGSFDTLYGGLGNDTLVGGAGYDSLNGGGGNDVFYFGGTSHGAVVGTDGAYAFTANTFDVITDFTSGTDTIKLLASGYSATLATLTLNTNLFIIGQPYDGTNSGAASATPYIVVDSSNAIYYDADSSTAGYTVIAQANSAIAQADIVPV